MVGVTEVSQRGECWSFYWEGNTWAAEYLSSEFGKTYYPLSEKDSLLFYNTKKVKTSVLFSDTLFTCTAICVMECIWNPDSVVFYCGSSYSFVNINGDGLVYKWGSDV